MGSTDESADELASALDIIATIRGGAVVESFGVSAQTFNQRQGVNIFDCESTLEKEVEWLRMKFPDTRFTLKEFTATG
jgi:hypothetical protein